VAVRRENDPSPEPRGIIARQFRRTASSDIESHSTSTEAFPFPIKLQHDHPRHHRRPIDFHSATLIDSLFFKHFFSMRIMQVRQTASTIDGSCLETGFKCNKSEKKRRPPGIFVCRGEQERTTEQKNAFNRRTDNTQKKKRVESSTEGSRGK
jgi:hypothetical protein